MGITEWLTGITAVASAVAAGLSAYAALKGPEQSARINENFRKAARKTELQEQLFDTLMRERGRMTSSECVRGLNAVEVVFYDCVPVREAWGELMRILDRSDVTMGMTNQYYRDMLKQMALYLPVGQNIRLDDIERFYLPKLWTDRDTVENLRNSEEIQRALLRKNGSGDATSLFPPPP